MNITENRLNDVKPVLGLHDIFKGIYKGVDTRGVWGLKPPQF